MSGFEKKAQISGAVMKISYVALIAALSLSTWVWVQEGRQPSIAIWVIRILPLAVFAYSVFKHQLKGLAWLCFVTLGYFVMAVTQSMSPRALMINHVELVLIVLLFCSATLFIRWHARLLKATAETQSDAESATESN